MGRKLLVAGLVWPLLLLTIVPAQLAVPVEASANPFPQMAMSFDRSGITVEPSFFEYGIGKVQGTLSIDKIPGERFGVILSGSISTGWGVGITPMQLAFMNNVKVVGFTVTVNVPPGTSVDLVGDLRIEARGSGTTFDPIVVGHVVVTVAPYYKLYIDSPNPYLDVTPGSKLSFLVELRNMGNSMDSYDIYVENLQELAGMGWTVSFSSPTVSKVRAYDSKTVRLYVIAPQRSTLYKAEGSIINVRAISQNARDSGNQVDMVYPFVVYERGTFIDLFATSVGVVILMAIVLPAVFIARRVRRWNKTRPRPSKDETGDLDDDEYDDDDYDDDDYEDDEYNERR